MLAGIVVLRSGQKAIIYLPERVCQQKFFMDLGWDINCQDINSVSDIFGTYKMSGEGGKKI